MLGIDKGTTYTKTNDKLLIRSTIRKYDDVIPNDERTVLEIDGQQYIIGEKGSYETDLKKSEHFNTKALVLTAISLSHNDEFISENIVVGLPAGQYSIQKQAMKNTFNDRTFEIRLNGKRKSIHIKEAAVFPEACGAFYSQDEYEDALIVDIGGLSVDTALFQEGKHRQQSTYSMGTMKLYSSLANKLNSIHDTSMTEWDIEYILKNGFYINGVETETGLEAIAELHIKQIIERLSLEYDLKSIRNVILTGGGAELLSKYFASIIPQSITLADNQFTNAIGYYNIGQVLFP